MPIKSSIPIHADALTGTLKVLRGNLHSEDENRDPIRLITWDAVPECRQDRCPIVDKCEYNKPEKCFLMFQYVKGVTDMFFRTYKDKIDEDQWMRIGMHLIPMYKILCRLKIAELGVQNTTYTTIQGQYKVHPIFREVREQIKAISAEWKAILGTIGKKEKEAFDPYLNGRPIDG